MKNKTLWNPSKFVLKGGEYIASRNEQDVGVSSRLNASIIAGLYQKYIPKFAKGKLVDLGCGRAPLFGIYESFVTENICVDWENAESDGLHLDLECDLSKELPLPDNEFNTIILSDVLEHIPSPDFLWREMNRILAPEGVVLMNTPFYYCLHATPHDYYRYTKYALIRFAESNQFEVVLLEPMGGTPEILADILAKHLRVIPILGKILANIIQSLTLAFIRTRTGGAISIKTSNAFPLGYFMVAKKKKGSHV